MSGKLYLSTFNGLFLRKIKHLNYFAKTSLRSDKFATPSTFKNQFKNKTKFRQPVVKGDYVWLENSRP